MLFTKSEGEMLFFVIWIKDWKSRLSDKVIILADGWNQWPGLSRQ